MTYERCEKRGVAVSSVVLKQRGLPKEKLHQNFPIINLNQTKHAMRTFFIAASKWSGYCVARMVRQTGTVR